MKRTIHVIVTVAVLVAAYQLLLPSAPSAERAVAPGTPPATLLPAHPRDVTTYVNTSAYRQQTGCPLPTYREAPPLARQVQGGALPPVAARLPAEPMVVEPYDQAGRYGGVLRVDAKDWRGYMLHGLFRRNSAGTEIIPDIARGYEYRDDYHTVCIFLRPGLRWSDGAPFTVDDILFWWQDEILNPDLTPSGPTDPYLGAAFRKLDDYTLAIDFPKPMPNYLSMVSHPYALSQTHFFNPKHYLQRWHRTYNPQADELAQAEGFDNWTQAFRFHAAKWRFEERPGLPTLNPWMVTTFVSNYGVAERNPYFWKVDTQGNQLPYIDRLVALRTKQEDTQSKIMLMLGRQMDHLQGFTELALDDYPFLKKSEKVGRYRIVMFPSTLKSAVTLTINPLVPDPVLREIFWDVRFRRALSLAIDRDTLNENVFLGLGVPRQQAPLPSVSFYKPEWSDYYIQYDPARANALLDAVGLAWDAAHQFRLRPDNQTLDLLVESGHGTAMEASVQEVLASQFARVGIKLTLKTEKMSHDRFQQDLAELIVCDNGGFSTELDYQGGEEFFWYYARQWNKWLAEWVSGTPADQVSVGVEPPDEWKQLARWVIQAMAIPAPSPEWIALKQRIGDFRREQLWHIGTVYRVPVFDLVGNRLRNFPALPWYGWATGCQVPLHPYQWWLAPAPKAAPTGGQP